MTGQAEPTGRALTVLNEMVRAGVDRDVALSEVCRMRLPGAPAPVATAAQQREIDALTPAARILYEGWREAGHPPAAALQEVRASGVKTEITEADVDAAVAAVFGRTPRETPHVDPDPAVFGAQFNTVRS